MKLDSISLIYISSRFFTFVPNMLARIAQLVERKSHNLKVVSSILTVSIFFDFSILELLIGY